MIGAIISSVALLLISVTMLARANDLGWRPGNFWMLRRIGFILAGFAPWAMIYIDLRSGGTSLTIFEIIFRWGVALVFLTTPYLPPFWNYLFGHHDAHEDPRGVPRRRSTDRNPEEP